VQRIWHRPTRIRMKTKKEMIEEIKKRIKQLQRLRNSFSNKTKTRQKYNFAIAELMALVS